MRLAVLLLASTLVAGDLKPQDLRTAHASVWNSGGVCRHAATAVWELARKHGHEAKMIYWDGGLYAHVIPVVKLDDKWCHVESMQPFPRFYGATTACRDNIRTDPGWLRIFSRRFVRDGTVRVMPIPPAVWVRETRRFVP